MKLEVNGVRDAGDIDKERVVIKATSNLDVGFYMLFQAGYYNDTVTNGVRASYWFPDKEINAGDLVILYTKKGTNSEKPLESSTSHFFYWGQEEPLWNKENRSAIIAHLSEWNRFLPE